MIIKLAWYFSNKVTASASIVPNVSVISSFAIYTRDCGWLVSNKNTVCDSKDKKLPNFLGRFPIIMHIPFETVELCLYCMFMDTK